MELYLEFDPMCGSFLITPFGFWLSAPLLRKPA
jgi:hypothetical protein